MTLWVQSFLVCIQCIMGYRNRTTNHIIHRPHWWCDEPIPVTWHENICIWCLWCICQSKSSLELVIWYIINFLLVISGYNVRYWVVFISVLWKYLMILFNKKCSVQEFLVVCKSLLTIKCWWCFVLFLCMEYCWSVIFLFSAVGH